MRKRPPRQRPAVYPNHVYMLVDPATQEAYRPAGEGVTPGPAFFTTEERARAYAAEHHLHDHQLYTVPGSVLTRMRGKLHWLDGERRT